MAKTQKNGFNFDGETVLYWLSMRLNLMTLGKSGAEGKSPFHSLAVNFGISAVILDPETEVIFCLAVENIHNWQVLTRVILQLDAGSDGDNATASKFHKLLRRRSGGDSSTTTAGDSMQTTTKLFVKYEKRRKKRIRDACSTAAI